MTTPGLGPFLRKEIRDVLRDRRALLLSFVVPVLAYPVIFSVMSRMEASQEEKAEAEVHEIAAVGAESILAALAGFEGLELVDAPEDPEAAVRAGGVEAFVEAPDVLPAGEAPEVRILYHAPREKSREARGRIRDALEEAREAEAQRRWLEAGGTGELEAILARDEIDVATKEESSGAQAGRLIPYLLIMTLFIGGAAIATDMVAGEKERGTLETLYLVPAPRHLIATAKFLVVWLGTVITGGLNLASMAACYRYGLISTGGLDASALSLSGSGILLSFVLIVPLAAVVGGILLGLSAFARNVKEAQLYLMPVMLLSFLPGVLASDQSMELDAFTALLPVANVALAVRDGLVGRMEPLVLLLVFVSSLVWGALATRWTTRVLSREDAILGFAPEPLLAKTPAGRHRAVTIAMALTVLIYFYAGQAVQSWKLIPGLILSLWVLLPALGFASLRFAGNGGGMKELFSWRLPFPTSWLGAVLLALGAIVPMQHGIMPLQGRFLPMPEGAFDAFDEFNSLSTLAIVFLLAITPGIWEEIVFRGVFLGLLRRVTDVRSAILSSSVAFGVIHLSVFRFIPTFALGVLMAWITVHSRSIFPAMLFHAVYNGTTVLQGERLAEMGTPPWWGASLVAMGLGFALMRPALPGGPEREAPEA